MDSILYGEYKNGSDVIMLERPTILMWSKKQYLSADSYKYDRDSKTITFGNGRTFQYRTVDIRENGTNTIYKYNPTSLLIYGVYGTGSFGLPQFKITEDSISVTGQGITTDLGPYTFANAKLTLLTTPAAPWSALKSFSFHNDVTLDTYITDDSSGISYNLSYDAGTKRTPKLSRSTIRTVEQISIKNPVINLVTDYAWSSGLKSLCDLGDPHLVYNGEYYYMTTSHSWGPGILNSTKTDLDVRLTTYDRPNRASSVRRGSDLVTFGLPLWKCDSHNLNSWQFYGNIFSADVNKVYWTGDSYYYCKMWAPQFSQIGNNGKYVLIVNTARYSSYEEARNNVNVGSNIGVFYAIANSIEEFAIKKIEPPAYSTGTGFDFYDGVVPTGTGKGEGVKLYPFLVSPTAASPSIIQGTSYSSYKCSPTPQTFIINTGPHTYYSMCIDGDLMYDPELDIYYLCFVHDPAGNSVSENIGIVQVDYNSTTETFSVSNSSCNVIYPFATLAEFASVYTTLNSYCTNSCQVTDMTCKAACNYALSTTEYSNTFGRGASTFSVEGPSLLKRRSSNGTFYYYLFYSGGPYNDKQYSINYVAAPSVNELASGSTTRWHGRYISQISGSAGATAQYSFGHGHHASKGPDGQIYYSYHMSDLTTGQSDPPRQVCISRLIFFQSASDPTKGDAYIYPVQGNFTVGENKKIKGF